jgi:hypothetical protein
MRLFHLRKDVSAFVEGLLRNEPKLKATWHGEIWIGEALRKCRDPLMKQRGGGWRLRPACKHAKTHQSSLSSDMAVRRANRLTRSFLFIIKRV